MFKQHYLDEKPNILVGGRGTRFGEVCVLIRVVFMSEIVKEIWMRAPMWWAVRWTKGTTVFSNFIGANSPHPVFAHSSQWDQKAQKW